MLTHGVKYHIGSPGVSWTIDCEKGGRSKPQTENDIEGKPENTGHPGELDFNGAGKRLNDRIDQPFRVFYGGVATRSRVWHRLW